MAAGVPLDRRVALTLLDTGTGRASEAVVSVTHQRVEK